MQVSEKLVPVACKTQYVTRRKIFLTGSTSDRATNLTRQKNSLQKDFILVSAFMYYQKGLTFKVCSMLYRINEQNC